MKNCLTRLVLSFVAVCRDGGHRVRPGHNRLSQRQNPQQTAGGCVRRERDRDPPAVRHELRSDDARRWTLLILRMRVGGPYSVTVAYTGGGGAAFEPATMETSKSTWVSPPTSASP